MAEFRPFWNGLLSSETGFTKSRCYFLPLLQYCISQRFRCYAGDAVPIDCLKPNGEGSEGVFW
jgi:hypothetical protein